MFHNERAERELRTLVENARSILIAKTISKMLWIEIVNTLVYVLNRIRSRRSTNIISYERWYVDESRKSTNARISEQRIYINMLRKRWKNFESKSEKMSIVGCKGEWTNYYLWDVANGKINKFWILMENQKGEDIREENVNHHNSQRLKINLKRTMDGEVIGIRK